MIERKERKPYWRHTKWASSGEHYSIPGHRRCFAALRRRAVELQQVPRLSARIFSRGPRLLRHRPGDGCELRQSPECHRSLAWRARRYVRRSNGVLAYAQGWSIRASARISASSPPSIVALFLLILIFEQLSLDEHLLRLAFFAVPILIYAVIGLSVGYQRYARLFCSGAQGARRLYRASPWGIFARRHIHRCRYGSFPSSPALTLLCC